MSILGLWFQRDFASKADELYQKGEKLKAAELYQKAGRFEQAAQVYAELEEIEQAVACYVEGRQPLKAAELLTTVGEHREALGYYERAAAYRQAGEAALRAKQHERAGRNFEKAGMFERAAETYAATGLHERALKAWEQEIDQLRQREAEDDLTSQSSMLTRVHDIDMLRAEVLTNLRRFAEAAEVLVRYGAVEVRRAGELYLKDKRYAEAAAAFLEANSAEEALAAIEKAKDADDALRAAVYLRSDKYREAGEILHRMGRLEEAAAAFEEAHAWAEAAELFEKADNPKQAAEYFFRADRFADAARCYTKVNMHQEAAAAYNKLKKWAKAAEAYRAAKMYLHAGNTYLKALKKEPAYEILMEIPSDHEDYAQASLLLVPLLLERGNVEGAEFRLDVLRQAEKEGRRNFPPHMRLYWQGRIEEARGQIDRAEVSYQKVLAQTATFRDTSVRLEALQIRAASPTGRAPVPPSGSIAPEVLQTPVPPPQASVPDLAGLPFVIQSQVEPWWAGVSVFHAVDRRRKAPVLMVSFPQSFVPESLNLRHRMGRYSGFGIEEVLMLHELMSAHGNTLLLYEPFAGRTLAQRLAEGDLEPALALGVLRQVCAALANAHKVSIVHQWLSPRTILVDDHYRLKLAGLGLADVLAHHDHTARAYLSPEVEGGGEGSPASDVFSIGLLGAELLRASFPAGAGDGDPNPEAVGWPHDVEEAVPAKVLRLLVGCLRREPLRRPSAEEVLGALTAIGFLPGQLLLDRYEILGELGRGGMSRVYRAHDRQFDEKVAIKTMLSPGVEMAEESDRLFREVQICRKISHPNVVRVHDFGQIPGGVFVIMEHLGGPGLDQIMEDEAPLPLERVRGYLVEIAAALAEAHRLKVVHRDLKPANVMLDGDRLKVMDFGIAHMSDGRSKQLTRQGDVVGSPLYMAPEQIRGQPLDSTCDLYALGVIAYGLLTGVEPFEAETATAVVWKHLNEPPPNVYEHRPDLPPAWKDLLDKLLAKVPTARYQSAEELIEVLKTLPV